MCGLNPSSADLVDVIHTNGVAGVVLNLGTMKVLGHVDFYPNGGGRQPECLLDPFRGTDLNDGDKREMQGERYVEFISNAWITILPHALWYR